MEDLPKLYDAILNGDAKAARSLTEQALLAEVNPEELVNRYMIPAMDEVGRRFEANDYFVPELLISARAMKGALELVKPLLAAQGTKPIGRVAIGTVKGDLHDIGKNLVAAMLEGGGFEVIDLGVDVAPEKFIEAIRDAKVDIVAMSALLTTTMGSMKSAIEAIKAAGLREAVKIIVGGAPITQRFAEEIGSDGFGDNASSAVTLARKLVSLPSSRA